MIAMASTAWVLLALASLVWSPWLGAVSAVLAIGALFLHVYQERMRSIFWASGYFCG